MATNNLQFRLKGSAAPMGAVAIICTLDTKGAEAGYLKERIEGSGGRALLIDSGMAGDPAIVVPDISREQVAHAAGTTAAQVSKLGRGEACEVIQRGLTPVLKQLYTEGKIAGAMAIGGSDGAITAAVPMQALPMGVPKLLISPALQGRTPFGPYVGTSDMIMMHSIVDILGINQLSCKVFDNAVAAILGMLRAQVSAELRGGGQIAATMYGNTTPAVMLAKKIIERKGYDVVVFHPNGTGGRAMEELIDRGIFEAVFDFTTHELTDDLFDGFHTAGPHRLEAAGRQGLPQLVVPGCVDFLIRETKAKLTGKFRRRRSYHFNPVISLVRTSHAEMAAVGRVMAEKLNAAKGPTTLLIPLRGFSMYAKPGGPLYDAKGDRIFISALTRGLKPHIRVLEQDAWINDPSFAEHAANLLLEMLSGKSAAKPHAAGA
jgi:uncharacterized protein (UPF0261 family)